MSETPENRVIYRITVYRNSERSITCGHCGGESFNRYDVDYCFCGYCKVSHAEAVREMHRGGPGYPQPEGRFKGLRT